MSGLELLPLLAIPTLVCTIVQAVAQCKKLHLDIKAQKAQEAGSQDLLRGNRQEICNTFNNCVVVLGSQFLLGDAASRAELENILADLKRTEKQLVENMKAPQHFIDYGPLDDQSVDIQLEKNLESTKFSIQSLATRKGWISTSGKPNTKPRAEDAIQRLFFSYNSDTHFCDGAIHLQQNPSATISSISSKLPDGAGYKCDYCSLEFRYAGIGLSGPVVLSDKEWRSLAKFHIQASISFKNLAAWYMCAICHSWNYNPPQIFVSPAEMRKHMKSHK